MVRLEILSGKQAGTGWVARGFPVRIGRSPVADLRLEENGVWEDHLQLDFSPAEGFVLKARPPAQAVVNGQPVQQAILHNGDHIDIGSLKLQFWLREARQRGLRFRERLIWVGILVVCLVQVAIIYWLVR
jgi:pSer/pThr/pTyr-binding forkhead associated (FHA) protein